MSAWMIVFAWWAQGAFDKVKSRHLTTDPACVRFRAPRPGSWLDRASRGLECEPCMVRRALGDHTCAPFSVSVADLINPYDPEPTDRCETCVRFPESPHPHEHPGTWIESTVSDGSTT